MVVLVVAKIAAGSVVNLAEFASAKPALAFHLAPSSIAIHGIQSHKAITPSSVFPQAIHARQRSSVMSIIVTVRKNYRTAARYDLLHLP